ncbi:fimbrial protein [Pararobbsia alpina]|uniref:Major fimbrial subunit SMF-1 n=1 Tax=Pararobbsia alpina TaxID=621374 RepID=A0A6S7B816_9BURK|nr:fimbrial protein [Pararobbsia alpina]CAB3791004.1 Major fimbrial subunit SMF-1 [Pararobbsia alpina]
MLLQSITYTRARFTFVIGCAALFFLQTAQAADGMVSFEGKISSQTCKINGLAKDANLTVKLPTVSASALATAGDKAGATQFEFKLTECTTTPGTAYPYFEPGASIDTETGRLKVSTTGPGLAKNVQVELLNEDRSPIDLAKGANDQNVKIATLQSKTSGTPPQTTGEATIKLFAQYVASGGAAVAGSVNTTVQYAMIYE